MIIGIHTHTHTPIIRNGNFNYIIALFMSPPPTILL